MDNNKKNTIAMLTDSFWLKEEILTNLKIWDFNPIYVPLIKVKYYKIDRKMKEKLQKEYDYLIVTSSNTIPFLVKNFPQIKNTKIFAVGKNTASHLKKLNYFSIFFPKKNSSAIELFKIIKQKLKPESKVLLAQSDLADPYLKDNLQKMNINLTVINTHTMQKAEITNSEKLAIENSDAVFLTSGSLVKTAKENNINYKQAICIGEKTALECKKLGMDFIGIAKEQNLNGMLKTYFKMERL